ncbi:hypothetical protein TNCV_1533791 [Trichonephila clavipes]|nr:hypothetical protein TNCV_1533791 [Trichonephila clavipes]
MAQRQNLMRRRITCWGCAGAGQQPDTTFTKVTKCDYGIRNVAKDSPKLQTNWEGLYIVLKRLNNVVVRIQKSPHSKPKVIHYNRLAPYLGQDE